MVIDVREEVPPELEKLECQGVWAIGKVGEAEGDGDAVTGGLGAMNGGGCGLKGGGKEILVGVSMVKGEMMVRYRCKAAGLVRSADGLEAMVRNDAIVLCWFGCR